MQRLRICSENHSSIGRSWMCGVLHCFLLWRNLLEKYLLLWTQKKHGMEFGSCTFLFGGTSWCMNQWLGNSQVTLLQAMTGNTSCNSWKSHLVVKVEHHPRMLDRRWLCSTLYIRIYIFYIIHSNYIHIFILMSYQKSHHVNLSEDCLSTPAHLKPMRLTDSGLLPDVITYNASYRRVPLQNVCEKSYRNMDGILIIHVIRKCLPLATSTSIMKRNQHVVSIFHPWNCFERVCMSASMGGMEKAPSGSGPCIYWRICVFFLHHGGF